jgi:ATP-dependent helicase YprA (DUF1998 family)
MRWTILAELGRIEDDADLLAVARVVCDAKPKARNAVRMVREWRLGRPAQPRRDLADELADTIDGYLARHPETPWAFVKESLATVYDAASAQEMSEAKPAGGPHEEASV